jgi:hypothetical protein
MKTRRQALEALRAATEVLGQYARNARLPDDYAPDLREIRWQEAQLQVTRATAALALLDTQDYPVVFVSGHLDLSDKEFDEFYVPKLLSYCKSGAHFVIGDARGADSKAQIFLRDRGYPHVVVYHMFARPRINAEFPTRGGFGSDAERDAAMTLASDEDLAWVRPGRETSGTAKNLARRALLTPSEP